MRPLIVVGVAVLTLAGAASAETRNLSGFTGVSAADRIRVEVTAGANYSVEVTGADADRVSTRINDGTLVIRRSNRPFWGGTPRIDATVRVTMPRIASLASSRGAELAARGINAQQMSLAASMGGELSASGACASLDASVSMGGVIDADELQCRDADIAASMGGEARVYASNRYDVAASMGGTVSVAGEGQRGDVALSMGGTLDRD
ncbi:MAG: GIN domain-containing protein [Caulobacteraceae bacterium]